MRGRDAANEPGEADYRERFGGPRPEGAKRRNSARLEGARRYRPGGLMTRTKTTGRERYRSDPRDQSPTISRAF